MTDEKGVLEDYIKKGLEKGFNIKYIKDILKQHGHKNHHVETAANNIMGLKYPDELKPHLDKSKNVKLKPKFDYSFLMYIFAILLIITVSLVGITYFLNQNEVKKAKTELEEIREIGADITNLQTTMKTQLELIKAKDLTIEEKEKIIEEQILIVEQISENFEKQKIKINSLILDIMNRMIGRFGE
jgi:DNA-binding transcriptional MerR regulator